jgi:hypothetical protein
MSVVITLDPLPDTERVKIIRRHGKDKRLYKHVYIHKHMPHERHQTIKEFQIPIPDVVYLLEKHPAHFDHYHACQFLYYMNISDAWSLMDNPRSWKRHFSSWIEHIRNYQMVHLMRDELLLQWVQYGQSRQCTGSLSACLAEKPIPRIYTLDSLSPTMNGTIRSRFHWLLMHGESIKTDMADIHSLLFNLPVHSEEPKKMIQKLHESILQRISYKRGSVSRTVLYMILHDSLYVMGMGLKSIQIHTTDTILSSSGDGQDERLFKVFSMREMYSHELKLWTSVQDHNGFNMTVKTNDTVKNKSEVVRVIIHRSPFDPTSSVDDRSYQGDLDGLFQ